MPDSDLPPLRTPGDVRRASWMRGLTETVFRCRVCGMFSDATVRPESHRRFIARPDGWWRDDEVGRPELPITGTAPPVVWGMDGDGNRIGSGGGWWVACGPFDAYELKLVVPYDGA